MTIIFGKSVQVLNLSLVFFFLFCFVFLHFLLFCFFDKKNLFVDLSRRTMLVKSAASTQASTFFLPSWTDCFFIDSINLLQIVSPVRQHDHRFYDHFTEWLENTQPCYTDIFLSSYKHTKFHTVYQISKA